MNDSCWYLKSAYVSNIIDLQVGDDIYNIKKKLQTCCVEYPFPVSGNPITFWSRLDINRPTHYRTV